MERVNEIVKEFQNNNYDSFEEFYELTSKILYVIINDIVKNTSDSEDIMQDTYMKFLKNIDKCSTSWSPQAYLMKIGKNNAINFYNKKKHELVDSDVIDQISAPEENDSAVDLGILDLLNQEQREIVELHIVGNLKFREISDIVDKPLGTVLWIYNKAIKYLRKEVSKNYENK